MDRDGDSPVANVDEGERAESTSTSTSVVATTLKVEGVSDERGSTGLCAKKQDGGVPRVRKFALMSYRSIRSLLRFLNE